MFEFKGTKGKWINHPLTQGNIIEKNSGRLIANCMSYQTNTDNGEHINENLANARLICAAPKMLKTLIALYMGIGVCNNTLVKNMRQLVKEAINEAI